MPKTPTRRPLTFPLDFRLSSAVWQPHYSTSRHPELQHDSIRHKDLNTSNIRMTSNALRAIGQNGTGAQNYPTSSSAHVALVRSGTKSFDDQNDEADLELWPQSALKQSRLMIWIDRLPYKGPICAFTAISFMVLLILVLGRPVSTSFQWVRYSYQGSRISPESLLYCKYSLISKALYVC